ncbi:Abortive infection protein [Seminavis robusta]|uniref:Abortive infection protein n=1 Tax=Seminavis robusta TaxID=568900 RepID=A0A9N8H757_9STRA|nr:Abortive infection protein [Seminavis robusta]|eukprot:Sro60_g034760.1 Abortive infection protein (612) ;mRNA; f:94350-96185
MSDNFDRASYYKAVGEWSGRLIFSRDSRLAGGAVQMEVHNAPEAHSGLIGSQVELGWDLDIEDGGELQAYVDFLTTDVAFGEEATVSSSKGRVHPTRLDGLTHVGPLESLAAARPSNSIHVVLDTVEGQVKVIDHKIRISKPPIQIRGKKKCLAKFLGPSSRQGDLACTLCEIQHYNPETALFDGPIQVVQIPHFPKTSRGLYVSTCDQIESSPVNPWGWYLYGHFDDEADSKPFVVEAWEPRRALIVGNLTETVTGGLDATVDAIKNKIWKGARYNKGTVDTYLLDPTDNAATTTSIEEDWKERDRFLVIHLFGGIGGDIVNEENFVGLIPGHFAFGNATIVRDTAFTNELQFQIVHRQIYAHNNGAIISGPNMWSSYCGDLERGWLGTRPISDIVVKMELLSNLYSFDDIGNITICPLDEMIRELNEMGARYRTGDGDGSALVSTAHSCVQDSSQALFAALQETYRKLQGNPKIQQWIQANPSHPQAKDLAKLSLLHQNLDDYLTPLGVRKDWLETAKGLRGTEPVNTPLLSLIETIRTWRTVVPRRAHDRLAEIFLQHGAKLWFIRTNQVGGSDSHIIPLAPARAFDFHDNQRDPDRDGVPDPCFFCK